MTCQLQVLQCFIPVTTSHSRPAAGAGRWRNCSRSLKKVMPASDLWNRSAEQKYMNSELYVKEKPGRYREKFSQLFFYCGVYFLWPNFGVKFGVCTDLDAHPSGRLITVCSPSCRWDVYLSYLYNIFKISHMESNLIYSFIYIYIYILYLFCPLLYTLQASISTPMTMTNSKRHALDGRTYHRLSNQIPIRDPMGSTYIYPLVI